MSKNMSNFVPQNDSVPTFEQRFHKYMQELSPEKPNVPGFPKPMIIAKKSTFNVNVLS